MENLGDDIFKCLYIYSPKKAKQSHFSVLRNHSFVSRGTVFLHIFYHIGNPRKWMITRFTFFVSPTLQLCLFLMERVNHKVIRNGLLEMQFISFSFLCWYKYKGFVLDLDVLAESVLRNNWRIQILILCWVKTGRRKKCVLGAQAVILFFCIFPVQCAWVIKCIHV